MPRTVAAASWVTRFFGDERSGYERLHTFRNAQRTFGSMPPRTSTSPWRHTRLVTHFMRACSTALALPTVILGSATDVVAYARGMRDTTSAAADTRASPTTGSKSLG